MAALAKKEESKPTHKEKSFFLVFTAVVLAIWWSYNFSSAVPSSEKFIAGFFRERGLDIEVDSVDLEDYSAFRRHAATINAVILDHVFSSVLARDPSSVLKIEYPRRRYQVTDARETSLYLPREMVFSRNCPPGGAMCAFERIYLYVSEWVEPLKEELVSSGKNSVPMFCFGSLMCPRSASRHMSAESIASAKPAVAFGVQRVFDRDLKVREGSPLGYPCADDARGMLNLAVFSPSMERERSPANSLQGMVNGAVADVTLEDLAGVYRREIGYDLVPTVYLEWQDMQNLVKALASLKKIAGGSFSTTKMYEEPLIKEVLNKYGKVAHTFMAPRIGDDVASSDGWRYVNEEVFPRPTYYEMCRDAAFSLGGPVFRELFYDTTSCYIRQEKAWRLASVREWEEMVQKGDDKTKVCEWPKPAD